LPGFTCLSISCIQDTPRAHTHTHIHTHTHANTHIHTHTLSLSRSLALSLAFSPSHLFAVFILSHAVLSRLGDLLLDLFVVSAAKHSQKSVLSSIRMVNLIGRSLFRIPYPILHIIYFHIPHYIFHCIIHILIATCGCREPHRRICRPLSDHQSLLHTHISIYTYK
jgi:hypothetical protein